MRHNRLSISKQVSNTAYVESRVVGWRQVGLQGVTWYVVTWSTSLSLDSLSFSRRSFVFALYGGLALSLERPCDFRLAHVQLQRKTSETLKLITAIIRVKVT